MLPLSDWPAHARRTLAGVFTDIDDTLTTHGELTPDAWQALVDLKAAGQIVIAITGRHSGWCASRMTGSATTAAWPVDVMVAENGALALIRQPVSPIYNKICLKPPSNIDSSLLKLYQQNDRTRAINHARMQQVAERVLAALPGVHRTQDLGGRETDIAFDYNECTTLSPEAVQQVIAFLQRAGMHTSISSIHIHGGFDDFNKWSGACWILQTLFGRDLQQELDRWVFVGDSGNDQPLFEHFIHSVGVANIRRCADQLQHLPRYITQGERGAGFSEVARAIVETRR